MSNFRDAFIIFVYLLKKKREYLFLVSALWNVQILQVLEVGGINFQSKDKRVPLSFKSEDSSYHQPMSYLSSSYSTDFMVDFQLGDLYVIMGLT